jgi:hypothetical protein
MIKICTDEININKICNKHFNNVKNKITRKIEDLLEHRYYCYHNSNRKLVRIKIIPEIRKLIKFIEKNLEEIITSKPDRLFLLHRESCYDSIQSVNKKKIVDVVLNYKSFSNKKKLEWCAFDLTEELEVSVCPYCNRNYIITVVNSNREKIIRASLDHFFSQNDFPILQMSFFNLIPSCDICNSRLKHTTEFNLTDHLHPYLEEYGEHAKFNLKNLNDFEVFCGLSDNFEVYVKIDESSDKLFKKINNNNEIFKINDIYNNHKDIVREIIRKAYISDKKYLKKLKASFTLPLTDEEIYQLAFGNYINSVDFNKRPFAKLTKDVAELLELI